MAEVLLYEPITNLSAKAFVNELEAVKGEDLVTRISSSGGSVQFGWPMIAKFIEHEGKKLVKVDGRADSMAAFFLAYADDVEALDVSSFVLHRAAYPEKIESNKDFMTEARWKDLEKTNNNLRAALESKIDVEAFERVTGSSLDDMFSLDSRIDVPLTAYDAREIRLINRVVNLTPERKAAMTSYYFEMSASSLPDFLKEENQPSNFKPNHISMKTTLDELKANSPDVYAEAVAVGVAREKARVEAEAKLRSDLEAQIREELKAELKQEEESAKAKLEEMKAESAEVVETAKVETKVEDSKEKELEAFLEEVDKNLK